MGESSIMVHQNRSAAAIWGMNDSTQSNRREGVNIIHTGIVRQTEMTISTANPDAGELPLLNVLRAEQELLPGTALSDAETEEALTTRNSVTTGNRPITARTSPRAPWSNNND